ncbi:MAG: bifunctional glutamate N-acetyltransferase/amino-acid acetyltransferase ArgJ [Candidatus Omnitrophica bacterium]|nr:bifunctional glutamate N-acetyltransferase/amino-acid acetyltransferase ArgJ [Candidatus Omnitrophota bacterium]
MIIYKKAILPSGFLANGVCAGIKKSGKSDLALFYSALPAKAAVQFTQNKIQAAPLKINKRHLKESRDFRAIAVNSGNANCFTGQSGSADAVKMAQYVAAGLKIAPKKILIASTGIIGKRLPVGKIKNAIPELIRGLSAKNVDKAKLAILTTDKFTKGITAKINIAGKTVTICGIAKGSGMIAPNMATMLAFIFTDADIAQAALNKALKTATGQSFNCISVDNCMSTNDTVIVMANGASRNAPVDTHGSFNLFSRALNLVCLELAKMIVRDAEGATKFIRIRVDKAGNFKQAKQIALAIANSALFKIAVYAESPNFFGRAVAAAGASRADIKEKDIKVKATSLKRRDIDINVSVNTGKSSATVYTCDLTHGYIKINAEYN